MRCAITDLGGAVALREALDALGGRLVFTNGCFDILHAGHVRYLRQARELGDALVVGVNGDGSVRALKGEGRPVNSAADRAEVLGALGCVDGTVIFDELRATRLIAALRPHVYAKGGDYTPETLDPEERSALEGAGSTIEILPLVPGRSTSAILRKVGRPRPCSGTEDGLPGGGDKVRLGLLGSGKGSNFRAILDAIDAGRLDAEVVVAISDVAGSGVIAVARERGIPAVAIDPGSYRTKLGEPAQKEVLDRLEAAGVDLVVLAGFMRILRGPVLERFAGRVVNIHPSLLPAFKGLEAWKQALEAGVAETGCTVHHVTAEMDSGDTIAMARVPVMSDDTADSLFARIQEAEHELYPATLAALARQISANRS